MRPVEIEKAEFRIHQPGDPPETMTKGHREGGGSCGPAAS